MAKKRAANKTLVKDDLRKRLFAALYVGACKLNGTEAARQAGFGGSNRSLAVRASELLSEPQVKALLAGHAGAVETSQREVLGLLVSHMRGTMADFVTFDADEEPHLDLRKANEAKQLGLLKKFKEKRTSVSVEQGKGEKELISETVTYEIELYDAQAAAVNVGKVLGMFIERHKTVDELPPGDMSDEDWVAFYQSQRIPEPFWLPHVLRLYREGRLAKPVNSRVLSATQEPP